jgi:hypothetical protein
MSLITREIGLEITIWTTKALSYAETTERLIKILDPIFGHIASTHFDKCKNDIFEYILKGLSENEQANYEASKALLGKHKKTQVEKKIMHQRARKLNNLFCRLRKEMYPFVLNLKCRLLLLKVHAVKLKVLM